MQQFTGTRVRAFVIWEPVLPTDWSAPSSAALSRISDARASQFWDHDRLVSHLLGEHDRRSIVWDHVLVFPAGETWGDEPPRALYRGGPVVRVTSFAEAALDRAVNATERTVSLSSAAPAR